MKIAFFVNEIKEEKSHYTTTRLAKAAADQGHEVIYLDVHSFIYGADDKIRACGRRASPDDDGLEGFLEAIQDESRSETVDIEDLDAMLLRNDPGEDIPERPWAPNVGIWFGQLAAERGVFVANDPAGLTTSSSKLYLQSFPSEIRPATLVSRNPEEIKKFIEDHDQTAVIKPLHGAKGENVFLVRPDDDANVNQMIEAVMRDGYIVAQEYLEKATEGDVRLLMLDGEPLHVNGSYAVFRRTRPEEDMRSNMSTGGKAEPIEMNDTLLHIAKLAGEKLTRDGMFFVGMDIVGDKLIEINVESPGGLKSAGDFAGVDFAPVVIEAIEKRTTG